MEFNFVNLYDTLCVDGPQIINESTVDEYYSYILNGDIIIRSAGRDKYHVSPNMVNWGYVYDIINDPNFNNQYHKTYKFIPSRNKIIIDKTIEFMGKQPVQPIYDKVINAVKNLKYSEGADDMGTYTLDWMVYNKILVYDNDCEYVINTGYFVNGENVIKFSTLQNKLNIPFKYLQTLMEYMGYDGSKFDEKFIKRKNNENLYID